MKQKSDKIKCEYCDKMLNNTPRGIGAHIGYWHKDIAKKLCKKEYDFKLECKECNKKVANSNGNLGKHLKKFHNMTFIEYSLKHDHGDIHPICGCGCGKRTKWHNGHGFAEFVNGHNTRGENNPMYGRRGENSPIYGIKRTPKQIENYKKGALKRWNIHGDELRENMKTPEYREAQRRAQIIAQNIPEVKKKKGDWSKQWWENNSIAREEWRSRAHKLLEEGKIGPQAPFKTEWVYNPFTDQDEYMHSSWETQFLVECIRKEIPITKKHGMKIPYTDPNGIDREYVPDFLDFESKTFYEIKGVITELDKLKWKAMNQWCDERGYQFIVLEQDHLDSFIDKGLKLSS